MDGVPDLAFAGDPITLEYVFKTLYTRLAAHEKFSRDNTRGCSLRDPASTLTTAG